MKVGFLYQMVQMVLQDIHKLMVHQTPPDDVSKFSGQDTPPEDDGGQL